MASHSVFQSNLSSLLWSGYDLNSRHEKEKTIPPFSLFVHRFQLFHEPGFFLLSVRSTTYFHIFALACFSGSALLQQKMTQRIYPLSHFVSGESGIRTHARLTTPNAFRVRPLMTTWVSLHICLSETLLTIANPRKKCKSQLLCFPLICSPH